MLRFDFYTPRNTKLEFKSRILSVCIASSESSNITQASEGTSHYILFLWRHSDKLPPWLHGKVIAHTSHFPWAWEFHRTEWKCLQIVQFYNTINILQEFCRLYLFPPWTSHFRTVCIIMLYFIFFIIRKTWMFLLL